MVDVMRKLHDEQISNGLRMSIYQIPTIYYTVQFLNIPWLYTTIYLLNGFKCSYSGMWVSSVFIASYIIIGGNSSRLSHLQVAIGPHTFTTLFSITLVGFSSETSYKPLLLILFIILL